jgi:DNA-binding MarR family transcriptional regulator
VDLDPVIHQPTRLRIMVLLFQNRQAAATWVRDALQLTDGNMGSHCERLAQRGYIEQARTLTPQGFQLRLRITPEGDAAFAAYLQALRGMLEAASPREATGRPGPGT